ncbi:MAG: Hsp70 family protein [Candidatus Limnocylindrales bacterium]
MARVIGIDLGTTYSAVSVWDEKRKMAVIIPNFQGSYTTPSVVSLNEAGEVIVGAPAKENLWMNPESTVSQIKREMGTDFTAKMGGETYNPQTISAFILRYLKVCAEKYLGEPVHDAVVTVPAYFTEVQKTATRDAGRIAGLNVHRLLNEPTAAAIAYGVDKAEGQDAGNVYSVYDLGGGTFDVSVIRITPEDITVIGTGGDSRLGGLDMDEEVMRWALRRIKEKHGVDLGGDEAVRRRLKVEAEGIKKTLVASETAVLNVPFLAVIDGKPLSVSLPISRAQFEMLIRKLLLRSIDCLEQAVASAEEHNQRGWGDLDGVLLVGGPTRLQVIQDLLKETLRKHCPDREPVVKCDLNPDEVVALGAAILAASLSPIGKPPEDVDQMTPQEVKRAQETAGGVDETAVPTVDIYDVTGHSLGIAVGGAKFHRIIEKETVIPITVAEAGFSNMADFTTELLIQVYQGEDDYVAANTMIGEVRVTGLDPLPRGQQMFEIKFTLDMSGTLSTVCTDLRTKKQYQGSFTFDGITRMSRAEIEAHRIEVMRKMADGGDGRGPAEPPAADLAAVPAALPDAMPAGVPDLPAERIPADCRAYWDEARDFLPSLQGARQASLLQALNDFASAVQAGDAAQVEEQGINLQDAVLSAKA